MLSADCSDGAVAQLGERLVCNQEATGSIPVSSTRNPSLALWPFVVGQEETTNDQGRTTNSMLGVKCGNRNHGSRKSRGAEHWVGETAISFWLLAVG